MAEKFGVGWWWGGGSCRPSKFELHERMIADLKISEKYIRLGKSDLGAIWDTCSVSRDLDDPSRFFYSFNFCMILLNYFKPVALYRA